MDKDILKRYDQSFYKIMSENFGDEIFVTDGDGVVLFVNLKAVEVIGKPVYDIIGRNVKELVEEGFFEPSATMEVIRQKKQVDLIQTLENGKKVLCTGVPVFDNMEERIRMVVCTTKDVELLNQIVDTIEVQKQEIANLQRIALEEEGFISGGTEAEQNVKDKLLKIAPLDVPVLLQGETGVGKGVVAKAIHRFGKGEKKPMVKINCGAIPENLIESELFGYEQGAFTGAERGGKKGKVELAEGGTLFLDEIGEMPLPLQVKLLDFLQDGTFTRVGGTEKRKIHTRLITATNRDLKEMCRQGKFRMDLYYRINVIPFEIPPLRERKRDLEALAKYFLSQCNLKYKQFKCIHDNAWPELKNYDWPGNIRELEHTIEHVYVLTERDVLTKTDFSIALHGVMNGAAEENQVVCNGLMPLKKAKGEVEKQLVNMAYQELGSTYKVAKALDIDQSTVVKLMQKHSVRSK